MLNQRWYRALGISIPLITSLVLFGFVDSSTNLFNTGLTPGLILGVGSLFISWAVYKNYI